MSMVSHPVETTSLKVNPFKQFLKGFAGPIIAATDVKIYREKKDGRLGKFLRTDPPTYWPDVKRKRIVP